MRWIVWAIVTALMQALGLATGKPLTAEVRSRITSAALGSAAIGGLLTWLVWHWLFDLSGFDVFDIIFAVAGAVIGYMGWRSRQRSTTNDEQGA